jgi:integrase
VAPLGFGDPIVSVHPPSSSVSPLPPRRVAAMTNLVLHDGQAPIPAVLQAKVDVYANAAFSAATRKAYDHDWRVFVAWCEEAQRRVLPADPETIAAYIAFMAEEGLKISYISRSLAAISAAQELSGYPPVRKNRLVSKTLSGIARTHGTRPEQKAPLSPDLLRSMLSQIPSTLTGARDRALLLLGFAGGFRRSELCALQVGDLNFVPVGLEVFIGRSKVDQTAQGRKIGIHLSADRDCCPVRATRHWLDRADISSGPVFRGFFRGDRIRPGALTSSTLAAVIKQYGQLAGLDPRKISGHSLRAGFVTSAYHAKKPVHSIMNQTGHKNFDTLRRYIRDATLFEDNASDGLL